ncbi:CpaD family pilus assembly lipoprotein [Caballeronia sp. LZ062]|uniref:CpaD family pilus assembly lipoprotein n=1 Tax=unclassified Caballeronia TaxID=2646786 RepID=UPI00285D713C|nr:MULTISPECIES: CpaD family pilus assembly lipoprotein [unclassified Caballeronia]MDR5857613.1 CpaD family pilus assembly lipoprotein [Caballeronia sp. LZ050]MDR5869163.1 CpaD family pilus assembly lipoprotein [Caballeronia sp. LZ062]
MKHARILTLSLSCAIALGAAGCFKPPRNMPNETVIGYDGRSATPPDCESLSRASLLMDAGIPRPSMQWGCATYTNLAAQLAHPEDIVHPQTLGPADAAVAASAAHRYQTEHVIPLDKGTSRDAK